MKKIAFLITTLCLSIGIVYGQNCIDQPEWTVVTPKPSNDTYEYRVEKGFAATELAARNQAIGRVFQATAFYLGSKASSEEINSAVQKGENFEIIAEHFDIPINKVCEYTAKTNDGYVVYILCQVAKTGANFRAAQFDHFSDCYKKAKNPYASYSFIPGMAQIKKGNTNKGVAFITSEIVCVGGIVVAQGLRSSNINKLNSTRNASLRTTYAKNANTCGLVRNIAIGGAVAVYIWNVIDGFVANGPSETFFGDARITTYPYADCQSTGLAINFTF